MVCCSCKMKSVGKRQSWVKKLIKRNSGVAKTACFMISHWVSWMFYFLFESTKILSFDISKEKIPTLFLNANKCININIPRSLELGLGHIDVKHKISLIPSKVLTFSFPTMYELELSQIKLLTVKTKKSDSISPSHIFSILSFYKYLQLNCHWLQQSLQFYAILRRNSGPEYI